jgi:DNA-binding MarR family transcriptional regulator
VSSIPLTESAERAVDVSALENLVGYALRRAQLRLYADLNRVLGALELRPVTFSILAVIEANPGLSQAAVGDALAIQRANMVALASELEKQEWIERSESASDRRQYVLHLSREGQKVMRRAWDVVRAHEERFLAQLSTGSRQRLLSLLRSLELSENYATK